MAKKFKRNVFLHVNRFQEQILLPFYAACFIALFSLFICALSNNPLLQNPEKVQALLSGTVDSTIFFEIFPGLLILVVFFLLIYWAYDISNKTLGAYDRILQEIDKRISAKHDGPIKTRDKDDMFAELVARINVLIEKNKKEEERLIVEQVEGPIRRKGLRIPRANQDFE